MGTSSHRYGDSPCGIKHLAKSMTLRQSGKSSLMSWPDDNPTIKQTIVFLIQAQLRHIYDTNNQDHRPYPACIVILSQNTMFIYELFFPNGYD